MATPLKPLGSPPTIDIANEGKLSIPWSAWFSQLWFRVKGPIVSTQTGSEDLAMGLIFLPDAATTVSYTMPVSANLGEVVTIVGKSGGWEVLLNPGQTITSPSGTATVSLSSTSAADAVLLICSTPNTGFHVLGSQGTLVFA